MLRALNPMMSSRQVARTLQEQNDDLTFDDFVKIMPKGGKPARSSVIFNSLKSLRSANSEIDAVQIQPVMEQSEALSPERLDI